ncbi:HipA domain-containing protein [Modicisalibacter xianhensis]|uniref:Serine/threonine-protein kinase HipA n=1 Tax=Modicisalibacter xianhensis TaxID=442341 RepID=A0A1I3FBW5_9GAMM|nr:HipA domain-containing protein [Halomonas xianhensis]SFI08680.1 serine/threonine-protein kinase HipA [Halomonas xianhensis]
MTRHLNVWINDTQVGVLIDRNGIWSFTYSEAWVKHPEAYPLCPNLPLQVDTHLDGSTHRPVQWYFDNLLPEEGQRVLLAQAARLGGADAFGLLSHYGAESAGSLTLLPPGATPAPGSCIDLSEQELSQRIREMPSIPLAEQSAKRMSLAGAQHKVAVIFADGALREPVGSLPSTHILKPDHPGDAWPHSVINEWFIMTLAGRVGLPVPTVHRRYLPEPVYLIERFDRRHDGNGWQRMHCIDACQLFGIDRAYKYAEGSVGRLAELSRHCLPSAKARLLLFQWLVFNVLVGNEDAHLKNLSVLPHGSTFRLAPFYDLLCTAVYGTRAYGQDRWPDLASLAWPVQGTQRLNEIDKLTLIAAGESLGIKAATARNAINALVSSVPQQARLLLDETTQENTSLGQASSDLQATLAGESRLLRAIVNIVINEMANQLTKA